MSRKETTELKVIIRKEAGIENEEPEQKTQTDLINTKPKDCSAKFIFDDPILCAQFLRMKERTEKQRFGYRLCF